MGSNPIRPTKDTKTEIAMQQKTIGERLLDGEREFTNDELDRAEREIESCFDALNAIAAGVDPCEFLSQDSEFVSAFRDMSEATFAAVASSMVTLRTIVGELRVRNENKRKFLSTLN